MISVDCEEFSVYVLSVLLLVGSPETEWCSGSGCESVSSPFIAFASLHSLLMCSFSGFILFKGP